MFAVVAAALAAFRSMGAAEVRMVKAGA